MDSVIFKIGDLVQLHEYKSVYRVIGSVGECMTKYAYIEIECRADADNGYVRAFVNWSEIRPAETEFERFVRETLEGVPSGCSEE